MTPKAEEEFAHRLLFIDITRAHPHCMMRRDLWVALPAEDPRSGEENLCAKLERSLYGTRESRRRSELRAPGCRHHE
eukprot:6489422-Amphidinium_carterae.3